MTRNYTTPRVAADWAESRVTHPAVAMAIHAIADSRRSPEDIWDSPTPGECDHVDMAVAEYLSNGDFEAEDDDRYQWGVEKITVKADDRR